MSGYTFGGFWFDLEANEVLRAGKPVELTPTEKRFLLQFLKKQQPLTQSQIANALWGRDNTHVNVKRYVAQLKSSIKKKLENEVIERTYSGLYRLTMTAIFREAPDSTIVDVAPEIAEFLIATGYGILPVGEFLPIYPVYSGLRRDEVDVKYQGEYQPPKEFEALMRRFPGDSPINHLYSFHGWEGEIPSEDEFAGSEGKKLTLIFRGGTWHHIYALNQIRKGCVSQPPDPECLAFRQKYLKSLFPLNSSPFYHNVNTEVIVVTSDEQLVIARRKGAMIFAGSWTVSLEEQMLRRREKDGLSDGTDLFACAERGASGELGITVLSEHTRLLSIGLEFGNFTAAFLVLIRSAETFNDIARKTWPNASECDEAVALDAVPANTRNLEKLLKDDQYYPSPEKSIASPRWSSQGDPRTPGPWHPVAKARVHAYVKHLQALQSKGLK